MKYGTYLREHLYIPAVFLWLLFSLETLLLTVNAGLFLTIYLPVSLCVSCFLITWLEYRKKKRCLSGLTDLVDNLDQKYLLPELFSPGQNQEEQLLKQILEEESRSMYEHVAAIRRNQQEYKEYIELWIHEVKVPIAAAKLLIENSSAERPGQAANQGIFPAMDSSRSRELSKALSRIEHYTEQALFYARSNSIEKDYLIREICLENVVGEAILAHRETLQEFSVSLRLEDLDKTVYSDSKWLLFILNQIIDNSIKYRSASPALRIFAEELPHQIRLHLIDNGIGINDTEIDRVFDKGFTGENGRKQGKSTGIGLYLCRKLCRRLNHDISVTSVQNQEFAVTISFPKSDFYTMTHNG